MQSIALAFVSLLLKWKTYALFTAMHILPKIITMRKYKMLLYAMSPATFNEGPWGHGSRKKQLTIGTKL